MLREHTGSAHPRSFKHFALLAGICLALAGLTACGGGGGGGSSNKETPAPTPTPAPEMTITPAPDVPGTRADAVVVPALVPTSSNISSAQDVDYFKLSLPFQGGAEGRRGNTVTFWTTGDANTAIRIKDGNGNDLTAPAGSAATMAAGGGLLVADAVVDNSGGRVSVTTGLDEVWARVTGRDGSTGDYTLRNSVAANLAPRALESHAAKTVRAGGSFTVDLARAFWDPEGGRSPSPRVSGPGRSVR